MQLKSKPAELSKRRRGIQTADAVYRGRPLFPVIRNRQTSDFSNLAQSYYRAFGTLPLPMKPIARLDSPLVRPERFHWIDARRANGGAQHREQERGTQHPQRCDPGKRIARADTIEFCFDR
jgi:hypothetical protein